MAATSIKPEVCFNRESGHHRAQFREPRVVGRAMVSGVDRLRWRGLASSWSVEEMVVVEPHRRNFPYVQSEGHLPLQQREWSPISASLDTLPCSEASFASDDWSEGRTDYSSTLWGIQAMNHFGFDLGEMIVSALYRGRPASVVRKATRELDGKEVAVKCLCSTDRRQRHLLRQEHLTLLRLAHPSIIRSVGLWESRFDVWLVTDLCAEGSVKAYAARNGPFEEPEAARLARELCRGVAYLQGQNIVHGRIDPSHLLLTSQASNLKISGFSGATLSATGAQPIEARPLDDDGTMRAFRAPEVVTGEYVNGELPRLSDTWSVGMCTFWMHRGNIPFRRFEDEEEEEPLTWYYLDGVLPELSLDDVSQEMEGLVRESLVVATEHRPSAEQLLGHQFFCLDSRKVPSS